jgi:putative ABC transport system permease protein
LLTECAACAGGAAAGLLLAILGVRALLALAPAGSIPRITEIHLDASVLAFALGLGAVTGIDGLLPAVHATGRELRTFLVTSDAPSRAAVKDCVVSWFPRDPWRSYCSPAPGCCSRLLRLRAVNPGFRPENVLTMTVDLPESLYKTAVSMQAFQARTLEKLSNLPACRRQARSTGFPSVAL